MTEPVPVEISIASFFGEGSARQLLRIPLFYKLVIANGAIAFLAVLGCAALVASAIRRDPTANMIGIILPVTIAAVGLGVLINAVLVRLALTPLRNLEKAAELVRAGVEDARASESALSDTGIEQVVRAFNAMLESLGVNRRRLRDIAIRALGAGEAERKRLASELHDNTAQSLAAILMQVRRARADAPAVLEPQLAAISDQVAQLITAVRGLAQQLRPPALDMLGLGPAILAHARNISETTDVRVEARVDSTLDGALSREAELVLYRVVQEALLNVVRHAQVTHARIDVRREPTSVVVEVADSGRGFAVEQALAEGALGLVGMYERASYIGGRVEVRSRPGRGTTIQIDIPMKEAADA